MSKTTGKNGRLCNQIIRNLALSLIAKKNNLYVDYYNYDIINNKLGIILFIGENKYNTTKKINDNDYIKILNSNISINYNLDLDDNYFQTEEITNILYKYLQIDIKNNIISKNPFKNRINKNNDLFIHIRLGDIIDKFSLPIEYYLKCIKQISFDKLYIASDSLEHKKIKDIQTLYPKSILVNKNAVETIQFGSTCKNIVLSHGSYSAVIAYLAFNSNIYYLNKEPKWCPLGLFTNKGWNAIL
jgi:hypothetical protein